MKNLWLVGELTCARINLHDDRYEPESTEWEIVGVFESEDHAIGHCITENHFKMPIPLNEALNPDSLEFQAIEYPVRESNVEID